MKYNVRINDTVYEVEVVKGKAQLLSEYQAVNTVKTVEEAPEVKSEATVSKSETASSVNGKAVTAPLPGQVVAVKVSVGQTVKAGEVVAIIEAMKMENEITAPIGGTVVAVSAPKGTQVAVGEPIVILS